MIFLALAYPLIKEKIKCNLYATKKIIIEKRSGKSVYNFL